MADSIPSLRRKLAEANLRIAELEAVQPVVSEPVVNRVEVPVDRIRVVTRAVDVHVPPSVVYVTDPILEETIRNLQEQLRCISQSDS